MNYKKSIYTVAVLGCLSLTGCSSSNLTPDEVDKFVSYLSDKASESDIDVNEVKDYIYDWISKVNDTEKSSAIINDYIYILYNEVDDYNSYLNIIGEDLSRIKKKLNIDTIDVSMYKELSKESKVIGAIFEEMYNKNIMVSESDNFYNVEVNMDKILKDLGDYMSNDLVEFIKFRSEEIKTPVYNINTDKYNLDLILKRLSVAMDKLNADSTTQAFNWQSTADYYYQIILAEYTNQFLNFDSEYKKVNKEYLTELKTVLEKHKSSSVYKDVSEYIKILEENDYIVDCEDAVMFRNKIFKQVYRLVEPDPSMDEDLNENIEAD